MKLNEKIEAAVRNWPGWSPAEQRHMDEIVEEVLTYCRSGAGNAFIRSWCERVLLKQLKGDNP